MRRDEGEDGGWRRGGNQREGSGGGDKIVLRRETEGWEVKSGVPCVTGDKEGLVANLRDKDERKGLDEARREEGSEAREGAGGAGEGNRGQDYHEAA